MKTKLLITLALVLTMLAIDAKSQSSLCPPDYYRRPVIINLPCCSCNVQVDLCYKCEPDVGGSGTITFRILGVIDVPLNCPNWWGEIVAAITDYNFIKTYLCPSYPTVPPCGSSTLLGATLLYPLCFSKVSTMGVRSLVACEPINCLCVAQYQYCYLNGEIITTVVSKLVVPVDGYNGPCPPLGDCSLYNRWSFDWPALNGSTPCFNMCDDTP
jgi:hypothetical protein